MLDLRLLDKVLLPQVEVDPVSSARATLRRMGNNLVLNPHKDTEVSCSPVRCRPLPPLSIVTERLGLKLGDVETLADAETLTGLETLADLETAGRP